MRSCSTLFGSVPWVPSKNGDEYELTDEFI